MKIAHGVNVCVLTALLLTIFAIGVMAQTGHAITGVVVDESGGAIVGAQVSVRNPEGGATHTTLTDRSGAFSSGPLPSGLYVVDVQQRLFQPARVPIEMSAEVEAPPVRIVLKVRSLAENVEVVATRENQRAGNLALGQPTPVLDVPYSVSTVSMDVLEAQGGRTLQDAIRSIPGAQPDFGFTGGHSQVFVLRGMPADSGTGSSRVLVDGTRLSNYAFVPAFTDRIDAVRGPGAAVGVRSEPGGSVDIVTKKPELVNLFAVSGAAGPRHAGEVSADLNRVLSVEHEVAARVIVSQSDQNEWRDVPDRLFGMKFGLAKSDGTRYHLRVGFAVTRQTYRPDFGVPGISGLPANVAPDRQFGEPWADSTIDNNLADLHADVDLSHQTRLAVGVTHPQGHSTSVRNSIGFAAIASDGTAARATSVEPDTNRHITSLDTSVSSSQATGGLTHHLFAGIEYYQEDLSAPTANVASPPINIYSPVFGLVQPPARFSFTTATEDLSSVALSVQDRVVTGKWDVVAGFRQMQQRFLYGAPGVVGVTEHHFSPRLGVLRHLSPAQTVYVSYSTGTAPNQVSSATNQSLPSRTSRQYEAGWKSHWLHDRVSSEVAARLMQAHMLSNAGLASNPFAQTVAGTGRAVGLEASLFGQVTAAFSVQGTYALTNSVHENNSQFAGNDMPGVAHQTASLWAFSNWHPNWRSGLGVSGRSRRFADEGNTTVLPGYRVVDGTLSYLWRSATASPIEVQFAMRNIFNETYYVAAHLHVNRSILPGDSRRTSLTASYRFGARP